MSGAAEATTIEVTEEPAQPDVEALLSGLIAFNEPFLGLRDFRRLGVLARRPGGDLAGGLIAETGRGFLFVDLLWVDPDARSAGLGSRLMAAAEAEARRRGCAMAWLDTYDFQARPFYERHGYRVFGELDGFPNGHRRFYMAKRLASDDDPSADGPA
ncbi:MAG TPA: GNAT family N-acetyltransferase [Geminicoccaceae bacterium]|nr:GNAT family N-acetyltransferase [Geminicoccaceae bacterium]